MMDHAASASYAAKGLSPEAVERSRKKHGTNELTRHKRITFFQQFLSNFGDPIIKDPVGRPGAQCALSLPRRQLV